MRFGQVHVYNNYYRSRTPTTYGYSWGVGIESAIYAENNFFWTDHDDHARPVHLGLKGTAIHDARGRT